MEDTFDVIVLGTGLTESILASALQRVGFHVLFLDDGKSYGGAQTTLNMNELAEACREAPNGERDDGESYEGAQTTLNMNELAEACREAPSGERDDGESYGGAQTTLNMNELAKACREVPRRTSGERAGEGDDMKSYEGAQTTLNMNESAEACQKAPRRLSGERAGEGNDGKSEGAAQTVLKSAQTTVNPNELANTLPAGDSGKADELDDGNDDELDDGKDKQPSPAKQSSSDASTKMPSKVGETWSKEMDGDESSKEISGTHSKPMPLALPSARLFKGLALKQDCPVGDSTEFNENSNAFNVDFQPRMLLCRGRGVDVVAESGVSRYLEFQAMDAVMYMETETLPILVPHSKAQVFASKDLSMMEKRQLMRFLQFCVDYKSQQIAETSVDWANDTLGAQMPGRSLARPQNKSEQNDLKQAAEINANTPFVEFLTKDCRMSNRLRRVVLYSVALRSEATVSVKEGMECVVRYVGALGRFGATPFLTPCYGTGEVCQGFSRLCAVYGGACVLNARPLSIELSKEPGYVARMTFEQRKDGEEDRFALPRMIKAKLALVASAGYFLHGDPFDESVAAQEMVDVHCVCFTRTSLFEDCMARVFLTVGPSTPFENAAIHGVQLDWKTHTVPTGMFMFRLFGKCKLAQISNMQEKLNEIVNNLAKQKASFIAWRGFYCHRVTYDDFSKVQDGLFLVGDESKTQTNDCVGMDSAFRRAELMFRKIAGANAVFLPPSETELCAREEEKMNAASLLETN